MQHRKVMFSLLFALIPCLAGCVSFKPPPSTQPIDPVVERYYQVRGGYLNALVAGVAARLLPADSSLHMSDNTAREVEVWRALYVVGVLAQHRAAAEARIDFLERARLDEEQAVIERQWAAVVPSS